MKNFRVNKTKENPLLRGNCTSTSDFKNMNVCKNTVDIRLS